MPAVSTSSIPCTRSTEWAKFDSLRPLWNVLSDGYLLLTWALSDKQLCEYTTLDSLRLVLMARPGGFTRSKAFSLLDG